MAKVTNLEMAKILADIGYDVDLDSENNIFSSSMLLKWQ